MALISLRLPQALETELNRAAETSGRSRSEIARAAIEEYLAKLTTQGRRSKEPLHVTIPARGGWRDTCQVMPEQPRTVDRRRLVKGPLTRLQPDEMAAVERSFLAVVGMLR